MAVIRPILSRHFKPALLVRMTIALFSTLTQGVLHMFVVLKIQKLADRLKQNNQLELSVSLSAMEAIIPS